MASLLTHVQVDRAAFDLLRRQPNFRPERFPTFAQIRRYQVFGSPDAALARNHPDGRSTNHFYNPITGEGGAVLQVVRYLDALMAALRTRPSDFDSAGRAAAWMAHFTVDSLSPAHHNGRPMAAWPRYRGDWHDPYLVGLPAADPRNTHFNFEWREAFAAKPSVNGFLIAGLLSEPTIELKRLATGVVESRIYHRYHTEGWTQDVRELYRSRVWPTMVRAVASLWYLSAQTPN